MRPFQQVVHSSFRLAGGQGNSNIDVFAAASMKEGIADISSIAGEKFAYTDGGRHGRNLFIDRGIQVCQGGIGDLYKKGQLKL